MSCRTAEDLGSQKLGKEKEISKLGGDINLCQVPPPKKKNKVLAIAVSTYAKVDIRVFWSNFA